MTKHTRRRKHGFCQNIDYQVLEPRNLLATLFSDNFESFAGAGFTSSPSAGQLDSDFWRVEGLSDGAGTFGGTHTSADFARGNSPGGVFSGGVYAFDTGANKTFGVQPTSGDLTPGAITLRVENTTGAAVDEWTIDYDIWFLNDGDRGNSFHLSYSTDDATYNAVASADFSSPVGLDSNGWTSQARSEVITVSVPAGGVIYFQWLIGDDGGSGNRDELALDNLVVSSDGGGGGGGPVTGTQDLRLVSYNVLNQPENASQRADFQTVFSAIGLESANGVTRPIDLLAVQETDPVSLNNLEIAFDNLYADDYESVISSNDSGDWFGFVYNTETLNLLETEILSGPYTRDPFRGLFSPIGAVSNASDFHAFSIHLNASNSGTRLTEANALRTEIDSLGNSANVIVLGDLNVDASTEGSYQAFLANGTGKLFDPINAPGTWNNNSSFRGIHTQNPRTQMDDRFDFQLVSDDVLNSGGLEYISGTYRAFGNNNTHTFNQPITTGSGASSSVLNALVDASDHLPVVADYRFDIPVGSVNDPQLFYNGSSFDAANDLDAVTDKVALLPGETATFANYTSYFRGINGMVFETFDFVEVPTLATIGDFFEFRVGNDNAVGSWATAQSPNSVVYQADVDALGTDLLFLTWTDNAIQNTWLQVTALANGSTGLQSPSEFYFGNAIAETGNSAADTRVNLLDVGLTRENQTGFTPAAIDNSYDFDRDGRVNLIDVGIARSNQTGFTNLALITPPANRVAAGASSESGGKEGSESLSATVQSFAPVQFIASSIGLDGRVRDRAFEVLGFGEQVQSRRHALALAGSISGLSGPSIARTDSDSSREMSSVIDKIEAISTESLFDLAFSETIFMI